MDAPADEDDPANTHVFPKSGSGYGWKEFEAGYYHTCGINDVLKSDLGTASNAHCFGSDLYNETSDIPPNAAQVHVSNDHVLSIEQQRLGNSVDARPQLLKRVDPRGIARTVCGRMAAA